MLLLGTQRAWAEVTYRQTDTTVTPRAAYARRGLIIKYIIYYNIIHIIIVAYIILCIYCTQPSFVMHENYYTLDLYTSNIMSIIYVIDYYVVIVQINLTNK